MDFRLEELRFENVRDFPEIDLSFQAESGLPHQTSLIQMPNGTGKTTTTHLLRRLLACYDFSEEDVEEYRPKNFDAHHGSFEVDFRFEGDRFTLGVSFNYGTGTYQYYHSKPSRVGGGYEESHWLPRQMSPLMSPEFVELFIFDGELATDLLDSKKTRARDALKSIYFLDRLESRKTHIDELVESIQKEREEQTQATTEQGLKNIQTRKKNIETKLDELLEIRGELEERVDSLRTEIKGKEERYEDLLANREELLEESKEWEAEIKSLKKDRKAKTLELLERLRRPSDFSEEARSYLEQLAQQMNILKLPKTTSAEFFRTLSNSEECICGRPIEEKHREEITERADNFLGEDRVAVLNALKERANNLPPRQDPEPLIDDISELNSDLVEARQRRDALEDRLSPEEKEKAEELRGEISELKNDLRDREQQLEILTTNDRELREEVGVTWKENIPLCRERLTNFKKKIEEATDTVEFGRKAEKLKTILDEVVEASVERLNDNVVKETNSKLNRILSSSEVQVEDIRRSINISGRSGVSQGQSLAVGYAFLSTLFDESPLDVPFIVDSPAGKLDFEVRNEVASIIPELFNQLVVFIISTERDGFVEYLPTDDKQFYTVYKDQKDPSKVHVIEERDFFDQFQSEEERGE